MSNIRTYINTDNTNINYDNKKLGIFYNTDDILSDHAVLSCLYNNDNISHPQPFMILRNNWVLTKHTHNQYLINNS